MQKHDFATTIYSMKTEPAPIREGSSAWMSFENAARAKKAKQDKIEADKKRELDKIEADKQKKLEKIEADKQRELDRIEA